MLMKKNGWLKIKNFFSRPKVLIWGVIFISLLIIALLCWSIYTKDEPKIIPEETREDVRAGMKEAVAEPLKSVSLELGEAIENAAYVSYVTCPVY
jgi:hypothetical protein